MDDTSRGPEVPFTNYHVIFGRPGICTDLSIFRSFGWTRWLYLYM